MTPLACIQGRYDGWRCFGRSNLWGNTGDEWRFGAAEESFDFLNLFYPRSELTSIHETNCAEAPQGWYTGTPYGYVDLLPFEGDWSRYSAVAFLGWHTYQKGDGEKMLDYVKNGGHLLLCRRHLNMELTRDDTLRYPKDDAVLDKLLGKDWKTCSVPRSKRAREKPYLPLDKTIQVGTGTVHYVESNEWPAASIRSLYESYLKKLAEDAVEREKERGWFEANEDVEFACYEQPDGSRVFYLLNIRWWDRKPSSVVYCHGKQRKTISVPFGEIVEYKGGE